MASLSESAVQTQGKAAFTTPTKRAAVGPARLASVAIALAAALAVAVAVLVVVRSRWKSREGQSYSSRIAERSRVVDTPIAPSVVAL
jgi:hypothetical protein